MNAIIHVISHLSPYGGTTAKYYGWVKYSQFDHVFLLHEASAQARETIGSFLASGARIIEIPSRGLVPQVLDIKRLLKAYPHAVIVGHYFRGALLAFLVSLLIGKPLVIPLHGSANLFTFSKRTLYRVMMRLAHGVVYNSHFTAESFDCMAKHEIIYNGYDFQSIPRKESFVPKEDIALLAIGGLIAVKQYDLLIKMMKLLPSWFTLTIIGDGPERGRLEHLVQAMGLSDRVRLTGYVMKARDEIRNYDVFLHPAIDESFGIVVAEALFACVPVIVTDRCATYEVIGNGKYGWVADASDPESWAKTVEEIIAQPSQTWTKVRDGREWAVRMFSAELFAKRMDSFVGKLLDHH